LEKGRLGQTNRLVEDPKGGEGSLEPAETNRLASTADVIDEKKFYRGEGSYKKEKRGKRDSKHFPI